MQPVAENTSNLTADLELILKFINTWNIKEGADEISSPKSLVAWLSRHGLTDAKQRATEADLHLFLKIREGLRALAMLNSGVPPEPRPLLEMKEVVEKQTFRFTLTEEGEFTTTATGSALNRLAGSMLLQVYRSMINGKWTRLKTCKDDTCLKVFYDRSRNHSGKWCSMSVCGNRTKVRNYLSKKIPKTEP
ncbi:MAG TPA: CGNR zinc finger domain-containing protein [Terriglobales bacterium]|nr:CGNR zinc finger domain-containing protein [Terriglobales bacterium]